MNSSVALLKNRILGVSKEKEGFKTDFCVEFFSISSFYRGWFFLTPMGDEKDSWKVKTLDEILQEKKRRKEQEEKAEIKRMKNVSCPFGIHFNGIVCFYL